MRVDWTDPATRDLRRLDRTTFRRVTRAIVSFAETGHGDVVKLHGREPEWRLRVGDWRVRFTFADGGETLRVLRVRHRREAYR